MNSLYTYLIDLAFDRENSQPTLNLTRLIEEDLSEHTPTEIIKELISRLDKDSINYEDVEFTFITFFSLYLNITPKDYNNMLKMAYF